MPTRILSWSQMVHEADADFQQESLRPVTYIFSNGRKFRDPNPLYSVDVLNIGGLTDENANILFDQDGNPLFGA